MPVNKEELEKDLETPEYQTLVKEALAKKEFVIQDKTEHAQYLDRYKNDVIEKHMPEKVREIYNALDKDIKETFGVDRDPNEKTYDYLKRAGSLQSKSLTTSAEKIKELEKAIAEGKGGEAIQRKLQEEEEKFKRILSEKNKELSELKTSQERTAKSADVKLLYGEIKKSFVKTLPPLFGRAEAAALDEAINNSVIKDGKLYMANADGSIRKDSSYNEITVEDFLKAEFKEVIDIPKKAGGAGSGPGKGEPVDPNKLTPENFPMKDDIKTKAALMDYMGELGLKRGSKEFNLIYQKYGLSLS